MRHPARELYVKWCGVVWSAYYFGLVLVLYTGRTALLITENLPTLLMTNSGVKVIFSLSVWLVIITRIVFQAVPPRN